jgi:hypothetical protein
MRGKAMKVWVVESGEYSQRNIDFVAASREVAVQRIRAQYSGPEWGSVVEFIDDPAQLNSFCVRFKRRVEGLCCACDSWHDLTEYEIME